VSEAKSQELEGQPYTRIQDRLSQQKQSEVQKYQGLVMGQKGILALCKYEIITALFGSLPGALGLLLRRRLYPYLFKAVGKGLIFGSNLIVRHADNIQLGDKVVIDNDAMLDAHGAGSDGMVVGDGVLIGRGATVGSKSGPIVIGENTSIGTQSIIIALGGITIGRSVMIAGGCSIAGGLYHTGRVDVPISEQGVYTRGPVSIGDGSWLGLGVIVVDGVKIGKGCVIGAGVVVTEDIPDFAVVIPNRKLLLLPRGESSA